MSTYCSVYDCQDCQHRLFIGFVGDINCSRIFCAACHACFTLSPEPGERYLQNAMPHHLFTRGRIDQVALSKKGRVKKHKRVDGWVNTGISVPIQEDLRQIGSELYFDYQPLWEGVACPACQTVGQLQDFRDYCQYCPACGSSRMDETEL